MPAAERAKFYPLMLDTDDLGTAETYLVYTLLVLAVFGTIGWTGWRRLSGRTMHPAVKRASGCGEPHEVSARIEHECQHATRLKMKRWRLTDNFRVHNSLFGFDVVRLDDLVWAYPAVVRTRYGGVIPMGKSHSAAMHFLDGETKARGNRKAVAQMLDAVRARAPWALMGYSDELSKVWKSEQQTFIAEVLKRKKAGQR
jgi:hypothetical protein